MNAEFVKRFLSALGVKNSEQHNGWVTSSCVLAPFTHQNGKDSNPSCGIKIESGKESHYNCYVCGGGSLMFMLNRLMFFLYKYPEYSTRYDLKFALQLLENEELEVAPLPEFQEFEIGETRVFQEWPEYWLDDYASWAFSAEASSYLEWREVPAHVANHFELRYDSKKKMIVCPYRNLYGKLAGARGRSIDPNCPKQYRFYDYTWNGVNNAQLVWLNEQCLESAGPVIVVEGQFDLYRVWQVTNNVVAGLTTSLTRPRLKKLLQSEYVIWMLDKGAEGATAKGMGFLSDNGVITGVLEYPDKDPATVDLVWLKSQLKDVVPVKDF